MGRLREDTQGEVFRCRGSLVKAEEGQTKSIKKYSEKNICQDWVNIFSNLELFT